MYAQSTTIIHVVDRCGHDCLPFNDNTTIYNCLAKKHLAIIIPYILIKIIHHAHAVVYLLYVTIYMHAHV